MNAIELLRTDHARLRNLLPRLYDTTVASEERKRLLDEVEKEIKMHTMVEEEIFYPAYKDATNSQDDRDMYFESIEEHHVVDMLLPELKAANTKSKEFTAKAKVLKDLVEHHIKEEEGQMFQAARQLFNDDALRELGDMMQARKDSVQAMWDNPLLRPVKKLQSVAHKMMPTKVKTAKATAIGAAMRDETTRSR